MSFSVSKSELVVVTGRVGSGKSSLLLAISGELLKSKGQISRSGTIAYVPQDPWVFSGTARENVLFGRDLDPERYEMVLDACELVRDIAVFPNGDLTTIGARGVLLSGGQKARVALARAVYMDADIYLLDDPLSAVDAKVRRRTFEKCICEALSGKTRFLVTHHSEAIRRADRVLVMEEGAMRAVGASSEVLTGMLDAGTSDNTTTPKTTHGSTKDLPAGGSCRAAIMNMENEDKMTDQVTMRAYWEYFRAGLRSTAIVLLIAFCCCTQGMIII